VSAAEDGGYRIELVGGPRDGLRITSPERPDVIQMPSLPDHDVNVFYVPTAQFTAEGAHIFEYQWSHRPGDDDD
jgi:hypothetical protein